MNKEPAYIADKQKSSDSLPLLAEGLFFETFTKPMIFDPEVESHVKELKQRLEANTLTDAKREKIKDRIRKLERSCDNESNRLMSTPIACLPRETVEKQVAVQKRQAMGYPCAEVIEPSSANQMQVDNDGNGTQYQVTPFFQNGDLLGYDANTAETFFRELVHNAQFAKTLLKEIRKYRCFEKQISDRDVVDQTIACLSLQTIPGKRKEWLEKTTEKQNWWGLAQLNGVSIAKSLFIRRKGTSNYPIKQFKDLQSQFPKLSGYVGIVVNGYDENKQNVEITRYYNAKFNRAKNLDWLVTDICKELDQNDHWLATKIMLVAIDFWCARALDKKATNPKATKFSEFVINEIEDFRAIAATCSFCSFDKNICERILREWDEINPEETDTSNDTLDSRECAKPLPKNPSTKDSLDSLIDRAKRHPKNPLTECEERALKRKLYGVQARALRVDSSHRLKGAYLHGVGPVEFEVNDPSVLKAAVAKKTLPSDCGDWSLIMFQLPDETVTQETPLTDLKVFKRTNPDDPNSPKKYITSYPVVVVDKPVQQQLQFSPDKKEQVLEELFERIYPEDKDAYQKAVKKLTKAAQGVNQADYL